MPISVDNLVKQNVFWCTSCDYIISVFGKQSYYLAMFNTPAMQNLMQQINDNPQMMQNMMNSPYMQSMMRNMAENPDFAMQV